MPDILLMLIIIFATIGCLVYIVGWIATEEIKCGLYLFICLLILVGSTIWISQPYHYNPVDDVGVITSKSIDNGIEYKAQYIVFFDKNKDMKTIELTKRDGKIYDNNTYVRIGQRKNPDNGIFWILCYRDSDDSMYKTEFYKLKK